MAELNHKGRAHAFLGASKAELWLNCPGSATANSQYEREESSYAAEGTTAHEVAQTILESCLLRGFNVDGYEEGASDLNGKPEVTLEMLECAQATASTSKSSCPPGVLYWSNSAWTTAPGCLAALARLTASSSPLTSSP